MQAVLESEPAVYSKVAWRLLPLMFILYVVAYLDRVNVGFAQLQMKGDLHFTDRIYGFGSGVFFLGYFLFEVPSNLLLQRIGTRVWMGRIMITWGLISAAMMFVKGPTSFYWLRFALGLAEAGFFPGMILYLTYWFPAERRARAVAWFMTATAVALALGSPASGSILELGRLGTLKGWQWLFLLEGIPAVILGVAVFFLLPNGPRDARWLTPDEREVILSRLEEEQRTVHHHSPSELLPALTSGKVWLFCGIYFAMAVGLYCVSLWLPQIVQGAFPGRSPWRIGMLAAIPYGFAALAMVGVSIHSDRTGERRWHVAGSLLVAAVGAAASIVLHDRFLTLATFSVVAAGVWGAFGPFWSLPSTSLRGTAAAGGIALINSVGCLGGFAGPYFFGYMKSRMGNFQIAYLVLAGVLVAGAGAILCVPARSALFPRNSDET